MDHPDPGTGPAPAERGAPGGREAGAGGATDHRAAVAATHEWFAVNSGWAPPDEDTLAEWLADGVCRCPDDCLVAPDGCCEHGLASWALVLEGIDDFP